MRKIIYLFTTLLLLSISNTALVEAATQSGAKTTVSAKIPGKADVRIYGYTAPLSIVQASSIRVFAQVSSDNSGYFVIDPLTISNEAREICLTTIDSEKRAGLPLCIGLPDTTKPVEIGPILLSPTISISGNQIIQNQQNQGQAAGASIPNSDIEISFFDNDSGFPIKSGMTFVRQVEAKEIPKITTSTDKNGSFSINLPANKALTYKIFAKGYYNPTENDSEKTPTPNSQTLTYSVSSYSSYWMKNKLPGIIFLLLFILSFLIFLWWEIKTGKGRRAWARFNEMQLKPFGVRAGLTRRRIWYNFQARLKSDRI